MPVATVFEKLESGATVDDITEWLDVTREQVAAVVELAARSLDPPSPPGGPQARWSVDGYFAWLRQPRALFRFS